MARLTITPSNLTSGSTTTNATSYTPSSVAPAASALLLLCVLTSRAGASPPTPSTVLIDFGGVAQAGASWSIDQFVDVNTGGADGADAVIQSSTVDSAGVGVTTLTTALSSSLEHSSNLDYVAVGLGGVTATVTQDARIAELDLSARRRHQRRGQVRRHHGPARPGRRPAARPPLRVLRAEQRSGWRADRRTERVQPPLDRRRAGRPDPAPHRMRHVRLGLRGRARLRVAPAAPQLEQPRRPARPHRRRDHGRP